MAQWPTRKPGVDPDVAVEAADPVGEALPVPVEAVLEGRQVHALDLGHEPPEVVAVTGLEGCDGEPAVPADHGRDPMDVRRRRVGVPEQLRVVVRVRVDQTGGDDAAGRIDDLGCVLGHLADGHDPTVADPDVACVARGAGAVDDGPTDDLGIEHGVSSRAPGQMIDWSSL